MRGLIIIDNVFLTVRWLSKHLFFCVLSLLLTWWSHNYLSKGHLLLFGRSGLLLLLPKVGCVIPLLTFLILEHSFGLCHSGKVVLPGYIQADRLAPISSVGLSGYKFQPFISNLFSLCGLSIRVDILFFIDSVILEFMVFPAGVVKAECMFLTAFLRTFYHLGFEGAERLLGWLEHYPDRMLSTGCLIRCQISVILLLLVRSHLSRLILRIVMNNGLHRFSFLFKLKY